MKVRMVAVLFAFAACSHASLVVVDNIFIKRYNYYTAAFYNHSI